MYENLVIKTGYFCIEFKFFVILVSTRASYITLGFLLHASLHSACFCVWVCFYICVCFISVNQDLTLSWRRSLSYRNCSFAQSEKELMIYVFYCAPRKMVSIQFCLLRDEKVVVGKQVTDVCIIFVELIWIAWQDSSACNKGGASAVPGKSLTSTKQKQ